MNTMQNGKQYSQITLIVSCMACLIVGGLIGAGITMGSGAFQATQAVVEFKEDADAVVEKYGDDAEELADAGLEKAGDAVKEMSAEDLGETMQGEAELTLNEAGETARSFLRGMAEKVGPKNDVDETPDQ